MTLLVKEPATRVYRLTVRQYHRMIETGVLTENDSVELLEGRLVTKMSRNAPHDGTIMLMNRRLGRELGDDWLIRIQSAITTRDSEPEPDLAVVSGPLEKYLVRHPGPEDVALPIEVAGSTLEFDRTVKGRIFARARIPVYWIANLVDKVIEVYTDPVGGRSPQYRSREDFGMGDRVPLMIQGKILARVPVKD